MLSSGSGSGSVLRYVRVSLSGHNKVLSLAGSVRYVRVSLSGHNKVLSLAEVQVFSVVDVDGNETDVALESTGATATQSSTINYHYGAEKAIDGRTTGENTDFTHTAGGVGEQEGTSNPWWEVDLQESYNVTRIVVWNRKGDTWRLSGATISLLDAKRNVVKSYHLGDTTNIRKFEFEVLDAGSFRGIQFPLEYHFSQDSETGLVDRSFRQEAFTHGTVLTNKKFSLVDPETNMALSVTDCNGAVRMKASSTALPSQQFRITDLDQLESIICPGNVLSVDVIKSTWMCKSGSVEKGTVTISGTNSAVARPKCNSKSGCSSNSCTVTLTKKDYCTDGNKLTLKASNPSDASQKWRFYDDGIVNLACGRTNGNFAITQVSDDNFQDIPLFEELQFSFVNPFSGEAIGIGVEVSERVYFVFVL